MPALHCVATIFLIISRHIGGGHTEGNHTRETSYGTRNESLVLCIAHSSVRVVKTMLMNFALKNSVLLLRMF